MKNNFIKTLKVKRIIKKEFPSIKVKFGKRLESQPEENIVYINLQPTDRVDRETFMEYVHELDKGNPYDDITLGVLHEIGHCFTHNENLDNDYNTCVEILKDLYKNKVLTGHQVNRFYIRLDLEERATKWAIDFSNKNARVTNKIFRIVNNLN